MATGKEGDFCKYVFYFEARNCGSTCTDDDRSIKFYTLENNV